MRKLWKYSLLLAGVLAAATAVNQISKKPSQGIFYRVNGGKNTMYLLGSIHVGNRQMYPMSQTILTAIDNADVLVFECDTTSDEAKNATVQKARSDIPLSKVLGEGCFSKLQNTADKLGYSMENFEYLKPWAVTSTLTVAAAAQEMDAGNSRTATALGVENAVRKRIGDQKISYLETAEEQLALLEAFSPELQEYLLSSACDAILHPESSAKANDDVDLWPEWWRTGNANAFAESYQNSLRQEANPVFAQEYHQSLVVARNRKMAGKIQDLLENEEAHTSVITVGLMHLVLPQDSIITMLTEMGYQVEQIFE